MPQPTFVSPRRTDRAVTDEAWIKALLHRAPIGTLATVDGGQPYLHTNLFFYDDASRSVWLHTARSGRLVRTVEAGSPACFTVAEMGRLLPAREALEFSVEYASVVLFGPLRLVSDADTAAWALQRLLDKYFNHLKPGYDYRAIQPEELARTQVYQLRIEQWSGKQKKAPEAFAGAFFYGQPAPATPPGTPIQPPEAGGSQPNAAPFIAAAEQGAQAMSEIRAFLENHLQAIFDSDVTTYAATTSPDLGLYEWYVTPHRIDGLPFHDFLMSESARAQAVPLTGDALQGRSGERSAEPPRVRFDLANYREQVYPGAAVASYTLLVSTSSGSGITVRSYNESRVLVKFPEGWKVVHVHKSPAYRSGLEPG